MTKVKIQKRNLGDIVRIDLADGFLSYARVLKEATFSVYDCHTLEELPIVEILARPILFQVAVMDWAIKKARWIIVGNVPLESSLAILPPKFIQDSIDKTQFSIYENGQIRPATRKECIGLECAAVWDPTHVEDRIRDHYASRPNKWFESLKIKD